MTTSKIVLGHIMSSERIKLTKLELKSSQNYPHQRQLEKSVPF